MQGCWCRRGGGEGGTWPFNIDFFIFYNCNKELCKGCLYHKISTGIKMNPEWWNIPGGSKKHGTVDCPGLCSDQQLSSFHLVG